MTYIRAWMSLKFGQIRSGTTELAALEHLKNQCFPFFPISQLWLYLGNSQVSVYRTIGPLVYWIFFILAGNKDNYTVSDQFEIGPDPTMDCGVSSP